MREIPFARVLVANRGEIAVRVIRTLRPHGITAVAVHTPADGPTARHAQEADLALPVPSYLDAAAIVAAARAASADAVHPGYGFASESPVLARACADAGIVWVGPSPSTLELMGDKIAAREHVAALGVPVVPGVAEDAGGDDDALLARAAEVGFPLIVKPSAGGGGKGMQVVRSAVDLPAALAAARRVAAAAFGDDTLLLERLVSRPRHIEAQVLGDAHGGVELLGLRECSLQRRHQKVIEEAPALFPPAATRELIAAAALRIAHSVDYLGAGTVEFLVSGDQPQEWYFLEMNTRLQVEHPVTEAVTGLDLVEAQLRVAAGEPLWFHRDVHEAGHAIEARVYAERPDRGFLPSTGRLLDVVEPDGVRVDSGVAIGQRVPAEYDPLLLKVVAFAGTRPGALRLLDAALSRTVVLGVHTNLSYLRQVLATGQVRDGVADTTFLDDLEPMAPAPPDEEVLAAAAFALAGEVPADPSPWVARTGWRLGSHELPEMSLVVDGAVRVVRVPATAPQGPRVALGEDGETAWVWRHGVAYEVRRRSREELVEQTRRARAGSAPDPQLRTPMPGTVVALPAPDGGEVVNGAVVAVVEAMKMEHAVTAPVPGILELAVRHGETVTVDQVLATIHPHPGSPQDASPGTQ